MTTSNRSGEPWWKFPLVWMVFGLPAAVVVASFVTLYVAISRPDAVLAEDYYRQGIEINKSLADRNLLPALNGRNHAATPDRPVAAPQRAAQ